ncbi:uncharacterized protein BDZ99DRAFT_461811 [Mytilinidion resinicola]|uniref:Uncharacterized protein n=1 Tax=Mytilinidion resinicola TaxID=574789 RepID=A0A6A6YSB2_9PEZI|nr:uncharacterized protein BDZ99DRAFT_461811 [Mytilinidion resinicola]KAF2811836.1 hypothetical protein BDZ99DRAFT_461811 [Mytilinidion resinicola]
MAYSPANLLRTCRQIKVEAAKFFFEQNHFVIDPDFWSAQETWLVSEVEKLTTNPFLASASEQLRILHFRSWPSLNFSSRRIPIDLTTETAARA